MSEKHGSPLEIARQIQALADDTTIAQKSRATFLNYLLDVTLDSLNSVEPFEECSEISHWSVVPQHRASSFWRIMMERAKRTMK